MQKVITILLLNLFFLGQIKSQIRVPNWPAENGYFKYSTYYEVSARQGDEDEFISVQVLMSESQDELIPFFPNGIYQGRTFSYAPFSYSVSGGPITLQVKKKNFDGTLAELSDIEILNVEGEEIDSKILIDENTIQFTLESPLYTSVYFKVPANEKTSDLHETIKHMLMIFPDPVNSDINEPFSPNKLVYTDQTTKAEIRNAPILVFRAGYHNIRERWGIDGLGITSNTIVWIAPGAVVDGTILAVDENGANDRVNNVTIYGRGILFNGNHRNPINDPENGPYWHFDATPEKKATWNDAIDLRGNNNTVRGILVADIYHHGIVSTNNTSIERVKIWGWHYNCDGMRSGAGTLVKDCFLRPTDDAFYAFDINVQNTLIWQSFNGAVITCGWTGAYNTGGIEMDDCVVIYPEWRGRGNNNGIVASQLGSNQECTGVTIENLTIYGDPIALLNLKPSSNSDHPTGTGALNGGVRNISLSNVIVRGTQKGSSRLESDGEYNVTNVNLTDVKIQGFAPRFLSNEDRDNPELFEGNNLTNDTYLFISSTLVNTLNEQLPVFKIFPNPVQDKLYLEELSKPVNIQLFDLNGRLLLETKTQYSIDVSELVSGLYILQANRFQTQILVKE